MFSLYEFNKLALLGSGALACGMFHEFKRQRAEQLEVVIADSNPARVGKCVCDQPILSLDALQLEHLDAVVLGFKSSQADYQDIISKLGEMISCPIITPDEVFQSYPGIRGWPLLDPGQASKLSTKARTIWENLSDEQSKREYWQYFQWICRDDTLEPAQGIGADQYFAKDLIKLKADEVFIDCGAYTGDTLAMLIDYSQGVFQGYYGFEPDSANFSKLVGSVASYGPELSERIHLIPAAVGAKQGHQKFNDSGSEMSSLSSHGDALIEVWDLDSYSFADTPSFIKIDLEGGDATALSGMRSGLQAWRPIVCVAIYHHPRDFIEIPMMLISTLSSYSFHVRSHNHYGLDFVLYCVPNERNQ